MKVLFQNIIYKSLRYRLHVSIIFWFILFFGFNKLNGDVDYLIINGFFIWHFALYLFDRGFDSELDLIIHPEEAVPKNQKNFVVIFSIILSIIPFLLTITHGLKAFWLYLFLFPITYLYTYPVFHKKYRAKNVFLLKNFYSAFFIWTLAPALIFYVFSEIEVSFIKFYFDVAFGSFIYVLIGEIFWDIRDEEGDKLAEVNTIPVKLGLFRTKIILFILLIIDFIISFNYYNHSFWIYLFLIIFIKPNWPKWIYHIPVLLALIRFIFEILKYEI